MGRKTAAPMKKPHRGRASKATKRRIGTDSVIESVKGADSESLIIEPCRGRKATREVCARPTW